MNTVIMSIRHSLIMIAASLILSAQNGYCVEKPNETAAAGLGNEQADEQLKAGIVERSSMSAAACKVYREIEHLVKANGENYIETALLGDGDPQGLAAGKQLSAASEEFIMSQTKADLTKTSLLIFSFAMTYHKGTALRLLAERDPTMKELTKLDGVLAATDEVQAEYVRACQQG